jgi:acetyl esterase/lipase
MIARVRAGPYRQLVFVDAVQVPWRTRFMAATTVGLDAGTDGEPAMAGREEAGIRLSATARLTPFLCPVFQDRRLHPAVIVLPGGGYAFTTPREGSTAARMFNGFDCAAFVLEYSTYDRNPETTTDLMLGEVRAAIDLVRSRATEWHVDPGRICLCGFSAGGHLAALAGNAFPAEVDRVILCYPALDLKGNRIELTGAGREAGADPDALMRLFAPKPIETVTPRTPPTFLWHTFEDAIAPVISSYEYLLRLVGNGVPCEAHVYQRGRHGLALANRASAKAPGYIDDHVASWTRLAGEWLWGGWG